MAVGGILTCLRAFRIFKLCLLSAGITVLLFSKSSTANAAETTDKESSASWKFSLDVQMDNASRFATEMASPETWGKYNFSNRSLLQPSVYADARLLFIRLKRQAGDGSLTFSKYQFGYGTLMDCESAMTTCSNGSGWEEPNCVFVKYCRNF